VDRVVLGGGASKSAAFQQLLAALFAPLPVQLAADQALAGARGSVYAFRPQAARSGVHSIASPDGDLCRRIAAQSAHYWRVRRAVGKDL
jgi:sugar (pentulose or hexulose) kinase